MTTLESADSTILSLAAMLEQARIAREELRLRQSKPVKFVTIKKFCELTGYTDSAVRGKISAGVWLLDREWVKAPDGHIMIDMEAYDKWVMGLSHAVNQ